MNVEDIRLLYEYNYWANHRTLETCAPLSPEQFTRNLGSSFGSARDTLVHILGAEWIWLERWLGRETKSLPEASGFPDFESVRRRWAEVECEMTGYVASLTPDSLERVLHYKTIAGTPQEGVHWPMLQHLVNHGSYHRGQIATMLRQLGAKPLSTDLIGFYREKAAKVSA